MTTRASILTGRIISRLYVDKSTEELTSYQRRSFFSQTETGKQMRRSMKHACGSLNAAGMVWPLFYFFNFCEALLRLVEAEASELGCNTSNPVISFNEPLEFVVVMESHNGVRSGIVASESHDFGFTWSGLFLISHGGDNSDTLERNINPVITYYSLAAGTLVSHGRS